MHNSAARQLPRTTPTPRAFLSATHLVRPACAADTVGIHELAQRYAAQRLLLPRTVEQIADDIEKYVVVADERGRVSACAALYEYSPSLAEIGCVAVAPDSQGRGLGTLAVHGAEAVAHRRGIPELFAMTNANRFFQSLGYVETTVWRYPEKLERYRRLVADGDAVVPRSCFRKLIAAWSTPSAAPGYRASFGGWHRHDRDRVAAR